MIEPKGKILIVDDEAIIRGLLGRKLTREGYLCGESISADDALIELEKGSYELVISDIRMPGKSGIELLIEVKSKHPDTAVIMATAVNEINTAIQCLTHGADDYVVKPFDLEQVSASVERSLERRKLQLDIRKYQYKLEDRVQTQTAEIWKLSLGGMEALVNALEAKDKYTAGHSRRVMQISMMIGKAMGLDASEIKDLGQAGLLHDVGKIAVNPDIQNKEGPLTEEEYEYIMMHAHAGALIVKPMVNARVVEIIEHHHDRFDGRGFQQNTKDKEVPIGARILAVADSFDAMTTDRPYRSAMSVDQAQREIQLCEYTQFDPLVVSAFMRIKAGELETPSYIRIDENIT